MKYYIARNGMPSGPYEIWQLRYEGVSDETLVWCQGLSEWTKASDIPEVAEAIKAEIVPPPFDAAAYEMRLNQHIGSSFANNSNDFFNLRPNNYLAEAIVVTLLCSLTGIVAIVFALKVNSLYDRGLYEEANRASVSARNWVIGSIILGLIVWSIFIF